MYHAKHQDLGASSISVPVLTLCTIRNPSNVRLRPAQQNILLVLAEYHSHDKAWGQSVAGVPRPLHHPAASFSASVLQ